MYSLGIEFSTQSCKLVVLDVTSSHVIYTGSFDYDGLTFTMDQIYDVNNTISSSHSIIPGPNKFFVGFKWEKTGFVDRITMEKVISYIIQMIA